MNYNNLSQKFNWQCGSNKLNLSALYIQNFSIPGLSFSHPELNRSMSGKLFAVADNMTFNELSLDLIIDETYKTYFELMKLVQDQFNPENGTFASQEFDLFIALTNSKGNELFKIDFYNARLSNIGDITLSTQGDESYNTLNLGVQYDYYKIENLDELASRGILWKAGTLNDS